MTDALSPLCPYTPHCGARATIGPCEPSSSVCCNHTITCQQCGREGTQSWNLDVGLAQHAKQYAEAAS